MATTSGILWALCSLAAAAAAVAFLVPAGSAWTAGPDACGYTAMDNQEVGGPAYLFTDITATGTPAVDAARNDGADVVPLPFPFKFCGIPYTDVVVTSNGFLCFGAANPCDPFIHYPDPVPSAWNPFPAVFGYFTDLSPAQCGTNLLGAGRPPPPNPVPCVLWETQGTAPDRVFIYMEKDVPFARMCTSLCTSFAYPVATFEIKLFESSDCIEVHIEEAVDATSSHQAASGIQEEGSVGIQYLWGSPAPTVAGAAVRYCQTVIPPPSCLPAFQTALVGQTANVMVANGNPPFSWSAPGGSPASGAGATFATSYAAVGTHTITVTDSSPMPASATCTVDVPPPACSPAAQAVAAGSPATFTGSGGDGAYTWSAPGGSPASGAGPTFAPSYPAPGTYTVTVASAGHAADCTVVVGAAGCGYTITDPAPYNFVDIMATGTSVSAFGAAADDGHETHPMDLGAGPPFEFEFCGIDYKDVTLSSNGYVCFELANDCVNNGWGPWFNGVWSWSPILDPDESLAAVYAYGTDMLPPGCPGGGGTCVKYAVLGAAPHRTFVYQFKDVPLWSWGAAWPGSTFEIILHEYSDCVEVQYESVQDPTGDHAAVAGYQDAAGLAGWEYDFSPAFSGGWSRTNTAWMACPPPRFAAWPDELAFNEDQPAHSFDVLANDVNVAGGPLAVVGHTQPSHGTLSANGGTFTYAPSPHFAGTDSFEYTIEDSFGAQSTTTVTLLVNPVNDPPAFTAGPGLLLSPTQGPSVHPGWATAVAPGPAAATDEAAQVIWFELVSNSNPALFATPPSLYRTASPDTTNAADPPTAGAFAALRIDPSGHAGTARLCFRAVDGGGTDTVWTSGLAPPRSDTGVDAGPPVCADVTENGAPVAYFEPNAPQAEPGQAVRFDPCPAALPRCSHDPDGHLAEYAWEFGDGAVAHTPMPVHGYARPGDYVVRLTVRDDSGAMASYVRVLRVALPGQAPVADDASGADVAPMADAGPDVTTRAGETVRLSGAERSGRPDAAFLWTQVEGPPVALGDPTAASPVFTAPDPPGSLPVQLLFALRVQAGAAASPPDHVVVTVLPPGHRPLADAGATQVATAGTRVVLAAAAADPAGPALAYLWEQVEGPAVALDGASGPTASFTAPAAPATLAFRLTVRDGAWASQDTTVVHVVPAESQAPPPQVAPDGVAGKARAARAPDQGLVVLLGAALLAMAAVLVAVAVVRRVR